MQENKKAPTLIISVLSLIVLGYVLYMSVYNQIIAQSDGFFNMIIFAGILLLVFILISLIIKLMAYTPTNDISPVLKYLLFMGGACLIVLSIFLRIKYTSSVPASESVYFKACQYINDGMLSEGNDIMPSLLYDCAKLPFAMFSSLIFDIIGLNASAIIYINLGLLAVTAVFVYLTVATISDNICGLIAFIAVLFMPGMTFAVYSYNSELFFGAVFSITLYLYNLLIHKTFKNNVFILITSIFAGIFSGIMIFSEPVSVLIVIVLFVWAILKKKQPITYYIFCLLFSVLILFLLTFFKSLMLEKDLMEVILAGVSTFNPLKNNILQETYSFTDVLKFLGTYVDDLNTHIVNNYYFLTSKNGDTYSSLQAVWLQLGNQLIYMFLIIFTVADVLYLMKSLYNKITPIYSVFVSAFIVQLLTAKTSSNSLYFGIILVILAFSTIQQMFLNHHPDVSAMLLEMEEQGKIEATDASESIDVSEENHVDVERARALVFYGENDALYKQIKLEERNARHTDSVITTKVTTGFEDGQYIYKEEAVEFLDEADKPMDKPVVAEVKAIPGTRPVEVVKPLLADETGFLDEPDEAIVIEENKPVQITDLNKEKEDLSYFDEPDEIKEEPEYFDEPDTPVQTSNNAPIVEEPKTEAPDIKEGFVIRKKEPKADPSFVAAPEEKKTKVKPEKVKPEKVKKEKPEKVKKEKKKKGKDVLPEPAKQEKAKPGEHLHNPLPLPKPHVSKDLDFDVDVTDDDDFDY